MALAEAYLRAKCHLDQSSRLATIEKGRKLGAVPLLWGGELGPHLTQCRLDEDNLPTKWQIDPSSHLVKTDMGRQLGGCAALGEGELSPHLIHCGHGRGLLACQVSS